METPVWGYLAMSDRLREARAAYVKAREYLTKLENENASDMAQYEARKALLSAAEELEQAEVDEANHE